jgi:hypothetical protein
MGYEGYERWLCRNGHLHTFDCYDAPSKELWKCDEPDCGEALAFHHGVD